MNTIEKRLRQMKDECKKGFMGHIIAGYTDIETSYQAALGILEGGADFLEIQFPFSDPFADGPLIETACKEALKTQLIIEDCFSLVKTITDTRSEAILIMTYANIIYKYGIEAFVKRAAAMGVQGLIIPDLPPENDEGYIEMCKKNDICPILLAAPGNTAERIRFLSERGGGFLYTVARSGVTGQKTQMGQPVLEWIKKVKQNSKLPIAVGFGISTPEQINRLNPICDLTIAGSFFTREIKRGLNEQQDVFRHIRKKTQWLLQK